MDNKMDNFSEKKRRRKIPAVENDQPKSQKKIKNKKKSLHDKNTTISDFDMIKSMYGSYYCTNCVFDTQNLKDFKRHLTTKKHIIKHLKKTPKSRCIVNTSFFCDCGNRYKYKSGLSKHRVKCHKSTTLVKKSPNSPNSPKLTKKKSKKVQKSDKYITEKHEKCDFEDFQPNVDFTEKKDLTVTPPFQQTEKHYDYVANKKLENERIENELIEKLKISEIMKQSFNQTETINKLLEQNSVLIDTLSKKPTNVTYQNCGNKKMTINVYLNERCQDAMNLSDFVNNMDISLEDLMYTQQHGYIKGISNIFAKHLKDLQPNERPIHCSDKKRMQFYVRDENKWLKDEKNEKIDKSIRDLTIKQIKHLKEWETKNPNYLQDEKLLSQWQRLVHEITGSSDDSDREKDKESIMKTLGNTVELKDNLIISK